METVYDSSGFNQTGTEGPRERIAAGGPGRIADVDLLKALLGSGNKTFRVDTIAGKLLHYFDNLEGTPSYRDLLTLPGMGTAKAAQIIAAWEFCRRRMRPAEAAVRSPEDLIPLIRHYGDRQQEHFLSIPLNGAHEVIGIHIVSVGLVNRTLVHPREVFRPALENCAAALICAHNHPSGRLEPSREDHEITLRLIRAGTLLGIPVLDHLIFHGSRFYSFLSKGKIRQEGEWES
ncbi:DNA repair protein RadC [Marispirochaeta sp.]|jgi:DNA repair protein RadC|uniref:JAB domain-containing protein n=1 Tax=Marispirochaeta sp. TaxID=2038653 RepID=UPI0029C6F14A|nr:DNA repair protein RadC [Marispirochaeta sp.]